MRMLGWLWYLRNAFSEALMAVDAGSNASGVKFGAGFLMSWQLPMESTTELLLN